MHLPILVFKTKTHVFAGKRPPLRKVGQNGGKVSIRIGRLPEELHARDLRHEQSPFLEKHVPGVLKVLSRTEDVSSD